MSGKHKFPSFLNIAICNDHGAARRPGKGYPYLASYMADNDLALGRIVEFLSHTTILSMHRTLYQILGLPPLNMFDALASDLSDAFTSKPGFRPYQARRRDIVLLISWSTLKLLVPGILLGLVAAFASAQAIRHLLFGVQTYDPIAYLIPSAIAISVAVLSGIAPLRAALVQPLLSRAFTNAPNGVSFPSK